MQLRRPPPPRSIHSSISRRRRSLDARARHRPMAARFDARTAPGVSSPLKTAARSGCWNNRTGSAARARSEPDPIWADIPVADALYVSKLAVARDAVSGNIGGGFWMASKRLRENAERRGFGSTVSPRTSRWRALPAARLLPARKRAQRRPRPVAPRQTAGTRAGGGRRIAGRRRLRALAARSRCDAAVRRQTRAGVAHPQAAPGMAPATSMVLAAWSSPGRRRCGARCARSRKRWACAPRTSCR